MGGAARAPASADGTAALTAAPAAGGTAPFAASVGGAPASSAVAATSAEKSAAEPATLGCTNKGGSRGARVDCWSGVIRHGSGGGAVDRRYCCPCCVGGEGG